MSHPSLFKEVAQRIVQRAQSSESDAYRLQPARQALASQGHGGGQPAQMTGTSFGSQPGLTSPTDRSPAPRR